MFNNLKATGAGVLTVKGPTKEVSVKSGNHILQNFWALMADNTMRSTVVAMCKIGTGTTATTSATVGLANKVTLLNGAQPTRSTEGETAKTLNSGAQIEAKLIFKFTFPAGNYQGSLTEYGLDFTSSANSSLTHTRVLIGETGPIEQLVIGLEDRMELEYTITLVADTVSAPIEFQLMVDGTPVTHTAEWIWSTLKKSTAYLELFGGKDGCSLYKLPAKPTALVDPVPSATAYVSCPFSRAYDGQAKKSSLTFKLTPFAGNEPGGYNYLRCYSSSVSTGGWYINPPIAKTGLQELVVTLEELS